MFKFLFSSVSVSLLCIAYFYVVFFKQKTAYEMRISDWSSDVCSSDLGVVGREPALDGIEADAGFLAAQYSLVNVLDGLMHQRTEQHRAFADRGEQTGRAPGWARVC